MVLAFRARQMERGTVLAFHARQMERATVLAFHARQMERSTFIAIQGKISSFSGENCPLTHPKLLFWIFIGNDISRFLFTGREQRLVPPLSCIVNANIICVYYNIV